MKDNKSYFSLNILHKDGEYNSYNCEESMRFKVTSAMESLSYGTSKSLTIDFPSGDKVIFSSTYIQDSIVEIFNN